jgi:hypothetical protein
VGSPVERLMTGYPCGSRARSVKIPRFYSYDLGNQAGEALPRKLGNLLRFSTVFLGKILRFWVSRG